MYTQEPRRVATNCGQHHCDQSSGRPAKVDPEVRGSGPSGVRGFGPSGVRVFGPSGVRGFGPSGVRGFGPGVRGSEGPPGVRVFGPSGVRGFGPSGVRGFGPGVRGSEGPPGVRGSVAGDFPRRSSEARPSGSSRLPGVQSCNRAPPQVPAPENRMQ
jgi:hypothetical protein